MPRAMTGSMGHPAGQMATTARADKHGCRLGGAHQVLDALTCRGTRAEPPPQALLGDPEHGHDDQAAGGQSDAQDRSGGLMVTSEVTKPVLPSGCRLAQYVSELRLRSGVLLARRKYERFWPGFISVTSRPGKSPVSDNMGKISA